MSQFYPDQHAPFPYAEQSFAQHDSATSSGSVLLAILAGAYVVVKVLDYLGYPVWLWIHMAGESIGTLRLRSIRSADGTHSSDGSQIPEMQRGGNVLGSVFGLRSNSLLQKGVRGVTGALSNGPSSAPPGLGNIDNSCYQNSVIQGLASLPSLRDYLSKTTAEYGALHAETTNGALYEMISKLNDPDNHGQRFWIRGKLKSMSTWQQQDAQEYYSKILDALDKEVQTASNRKRRTSLSWALAAKGLSNSPLVGAENKEEAPIDDEDDEQAPPDPPKIVPNPLDGLLAQRVGCIECGYSEGLQLIPFNCITVSLGGDHWAYDIRACLDEYTGLEYIEGVECAKCTLLRLRDTLAPLAALKADYKTRLESIVDALEDDDFDDKTLIKKFNVPKKNWSKSTKSRQAVIARAPKALVLHVNRSIFDEMTGAQYKNNSGVVYPRLLDLSHWCLGSRPSKSHLPDNAEEEWPRDPTKSMLIDSPASSGQPSRFQYQLRAAVTHYGSHGNGHYVCYRSHGASLGTDSDAKVTSGEQWWRFSDESVYAVSEQEAHQGNVFMLFYERIDEPAPSLLYDFNTLQTDFPVDDDLPLPPTDLKPSSIDVLDVFATSIPLPGGDDESISDIVSAPDAPAPPIVPAPPEESPTTPHTEEHITEDPEAYPALHSDEATPAVPENMEIPDAGLEETLEHPDTSPDRPSTALHEDTEVSEVDSEDAPSTLLTSDDDNQDVVSNRPLPKIPPSPHLMRTAGESAPRGEHGSPSLPMVTAT